MMEKTTTTTTTTQPLPYWSVLTDALVKERNGLFPNLLRCRQNICLSGGGVVGFYETGVLCYLQSLISSTIVTTNNFHHIYGTSAGAFAAVFLAYILNEPNNKWIIDKFMEKVDDIFFSRKPTTTTKRRACYYFRKLLEELLPENINEYCTDRVFIKIYVFENFQFREKIISQYASKAHVIDAVYASMAIPLLSIPYMWHSYYCPYENKYFMAFDGLFPTIVDLSYPTLNVNIMLHTYPMWKRINVFENSYDFLVMEGIMDMDRFLQQQQEEEEDKEYVVEEGGVLHYNNMLLEKKSSLGRKKMRLVVYNLGFLMVSYFLINST